MRVRITKCRSKESWYVELIGLIVEVIDESGPSLWKTTSGNFILKEDAEIVPDAPSAETRKVIDEAGNVIEVYQNAEWLYGQWGFVPVDKDNGTWLSQRSWRPIEHEETALEKARRLGNELKAIFRNDVNYNIGDENMFTSRDDFYCRFNSVIPVLDAYESAVQEASKGKWTKEDMWHAFKEGSKRLLGREQFFAWLREQEAAGEKV